MHEVGELVVTVIGALTICFLAVMIPYWLTKPFCKPSVTSISAAERAEARARLAKKHNK